VRRFNHHKKNIIDDQTKKKFRIKKNKPWNSTNKTSGLFFPQPNPFEQDGVFMEYSDKKRHSKCLMY
jgi:hypothetical protein